MVKRPPRMNCYATQEEIDEITWAAEQRRMSVSALLRELGLKYARGLRFRKLKATRKEK